MSREAYNLFFQEFIERFESYKNILLCTQNVFLKIVNNDVK